MKIHSHEPRGGILAFLTGQEEIERAVGILKEHEDKRGTDGRKYIFTNMCVLFKMFLKP